MRDASLAQFFRSRQVALQRSLPLGSELLKPVQRILKYHLLLQEIAKHFDPQEEGFEVLEEAIYSMTGVAWYINDMKRRHEHAVRVQEVQSLLWNWTGPDLTTYGELVLEGTFKVPRGRKDRTLFLFQRTLLVCKRRGEHYTHKKSISCSALMFSESSRDSLSFSVAHYKQPKQAQSLQARNLEEKKLWAHHIKRIILENHYAIIPQRAKEAILDLDSVQPPQYRYSPDRLKKSLSGHSEDSAVQLSDSDAGLEPSRRQEEQQQEEQQQQAEVGGASLNGPGGSGGPEPTEPSEDEKQSKPARSPGPDPDPDPVSDPDRPGGFEASRPDGDTEPPEDSSPAIPDSDPKTPSSGESSEDEEDGQRQAAGGGAGGGASILPSSVLDQAGLIAQHFSGSVRRGSAAPEDPASPRGPGGTGSRGPGPASPRGPSRTGSRGPGPASPWGPSRTPAVDELDAAETVEPSGLSSPSSPSPGENGVSDWRRRDSTLSKQDQLLIGKIKSYYETAETRDPALGLQRRESLTYIPAGLVRTSVSRFNSVPKDESWTCGPDPGSEPLKATGSAQPDPADPADSASPGSPSFRPSSEMIKVWQAMEREFSRETRTGDQDPHRTSRTTRLGDQTPSGQPEGGASDPEGGASDPEGGASCAGGGASDPEGGASCAGGGASDPEGGTSGTGGGASDPEGGASDPNTVRSSGPKLKAQAVDRPATRVVQLGAPDVDAGLDPDLDQNQNQPEDEDRMKSKVLHLARQYSQRIKGGGPVVHQRVPGLPARKTLACVLEEDGPGSASQTLPRSPRTQTSSPAPPAPGVPCRSRGLSPGRPQTLQSALQPEVFRWPDVRELRTRYGARPGPAGPDRPGPDHSRAGGPRRRSTPDRMWAGGPGRRSSCSAGARQDQAVSQDLLLGEPRDLQDRVFGPNHPDHYVAAEAPLPGDPDHRVIVLERAEADQDQDYVQIRSPTSREKICILAVADRCRAYQDSPQYRARTGSVPEAAEGGETQRVRGTGRDQQRPAETDAGPQRPAETSGAQQNLVKNLRERFQSLN
ncbi:pleckstrin homology domain-containing family G member 3-like isoform X3 [Salarias fasciatus]|uniref:pleckstrin homology domain-containing family G member 3-like isoform X3 n=1 Tax=Salarias fasciatus TaxID=181472 RepID=UPI001176D796|nr:pleckstrin homology domain-containing family G member 3-like isoform X3 [Salarias fasciatus]